MLRHTATQPPRQRRGVRKRLEEVTELKLHTHRHTHTHAHKHTPS